MTTTTNSNGEAASRRIQPRYEQLIQAGLDEFKQAGRDELVIRNRISALRTFMKFMRLSEGDIVGQELGVDFDRELIRWCDDMRARAMAPRTIEDRTGFLLRWREIALNLSKTDTLSLVFVEALREVIDRSGLSHKSLSKLTGVSHQAIGDWASGRRRPMRNVAQQIAKIEQGLKLPAGTLASRLGFVIERYQVTKAARANKNVKTKYGHRLSEMYQSDVRLNYLKKPHESVRKEWTQLIAHKVNEFRPRASSGDVWRVKPEKKSGTKGHWASVSPAGRVAAADAAWTYLSRYLSWLCLSDEHGGFGLPEDRVSTLAWVVRDDLFFRCVQWARMRSGGVMHRGLAQMFNYAAMLLRPETGWLWLNPQVVYSFNARDVPIGADLDTSSNAKVKELWQAECARAAALYKKQAEAVMKSKNLEKSRDPIEPISDILKLKRPLSVVMDMLVTLKRNPPPVHALKSRAVWLRDVLLLAFMTANPLRAQHFSTMECHANGGNLYKDGDIWHYCAKSWEFKNSPGDYDVALPKYVGDAIEDYFRDGRPHLYYGVGCNYVFMPARCGPQTTTDSTGTELPERPGMWSTEALAHRFRLITRGLRNGLPGFGPHAMRHIVATDYLKRHPGAFKLVAHLLNDALETVIQEYGHVSPQDGLELHYQSADLELRRAMGEAVMPE